MNNSDSENLIVVKIDHTINANQQRLYRFQQDTGLQRPTPIRSIRSSTRIRRNRSVHWCSVHARSHAESGQSVQPWV